MPGAVLRVTRTVPVNEELVCSIVHSATTGGMAGWRHASSEKTHQFKKLGFIEYDRELPLKVNGSLLSVVLHDLRRPIGLRSIS